MGLKAPLHFDRSNWFQLPARQKRTRGINRAAKRAERIHRQSLDARGFTVPRWMRRSANANEQRHSDSDEDDSDEDGSDEDDSDESRIERNGPENTGLEAILRPAAAKPDIRPTQARAEVTSKNLLWHGTAVNDEPEPEKIYKRRTKRSQEFYAHQRARLREKKAGWERRDRHRERQRLRAQRREERLAGTV